MTLDARVENVAIHSPKVTFSIKKWRNSKIWGEFFVILHPYSRN